MTFGAFGAGPFGPNNSFWFNAQSAYVGCDNGATDPSLTSDFVATAWKWNEAEAQNFVTFTQHFTQEPCANFTNCQLTQIFFDVAEFQGLSQVSLYCNVQGLQKMFWMDTVELSWWNSTCAAGLQREETR